MKRFIGIVLTLPWFTLTAQAQDTPLPEAKALWSIHNDDCAAVNADGPDWLECGFQDYQTTADNSRTLTVSALGQVQLWDGNGKEIANIGWPDQPTGASGYPDAHVKIVGDTGVAVVHQNQLILIDLKTGETRLKKILDLMLVDELRTDQAGHLFAGMKDKEWNSSAAEISLIDGTIGPRLGGFPTDSLRNGYWVDGTEAPFTIHFADPTKSPVQSPRGCSPLDLKNCVWWDKGSKIHLFDLEGGTWRSVDIGYKLDEYSLVKIVRAGERLYAALCDKGGDGYPSLRNCLLVDLSDGRKFFDFKANHFEAFGAVDEQGEPEIRLIIRNENKQERTAIRVRRDGQSRVISDNFIGSVSLPGGGVITAKQDDNRQSVIIGPDGVPISILPVPAHSFGNSYGPANDESPITTRRKKWLLGVAMPRPKGADQEMEFDNIGLTLFEIAP